MRCRPSLVVQMMRVKIFNFSDKFQFDTYEGRAITLLQHTTKQKILSKDFSAHCFPTSDIAPLR